MCFFFPLNFLQQSLHSNRTRCFRGFLNKWPPNTLENIDISLWARRKIKKAKHFNWKNVAWSVMLQHMYNPNAGAVWNVDMQNSTARLWGLLQKYWSKTMPTFYPSEPHWTPWQYLIHGSISRSTQLDTWHKMLPNRRNLKFLPCLLQIHRVNEKFVMISDQEIVTNFRNR